MDVKETTQKEEDDEKSSKSTLHVCDQYTGRIMRKKKNPKGRVPQSTREVNTQNFITHLLDYGFQILFTHSGITNQENFILWNKKRTILCNLSVLFNPGCKSENRYTETQNSKINSCELIFELKSNDAEITDKVKLVQRIQKKNFFKEGYFSTDNLSNISIYYSWKPTMRKFPNNISTIVNKFIQEGFEFKNKWESKHIMLLIGFGLVDYSYQNSPEEDLRVQQDLDHCIANIKDLEIQNFIKEYYMYQQKISFL